MVHKCMVTSLMRELHPWVEEQTPGPSEYAPSPPAINGVVLSPYPLCPMLGTSQISELVQAGSTNLFVRPLSSRRRIGVKSDIGAEKFVSKNGGFVKLVHR